MTDQPTTYTREDVAAVTRYLVALVDTDRDEHQAAFVAMLEGNPFARLVALGHLTAGLMVESETPPEQVVAAVFDLSGRVSDALGEQA